SEIKPIFTMFLLGSKLRGSGLRVYTVQHARIRNRLAHVFELADPGHNPLDPHSEAAVRHRSVSPEVQIPLERLLRKVVLFDALQQQIEVGEAFTAADDLAVAL